MCTKTMTIDISSSTTAMSMKEIDELIVNKLYQQPNTQQNHQEINRQKLLPEQTLPTLNVWNDNNHELLYRNWLFLKNSSSNLKTL